MKIFRMLLLTTLFCSSVIFGENIIRIQSTHTMSGDTGSFTIVMKNDMTVNGMHFTLTYEPNLIKPIKITPVERAGSLTGSTALLFEDNKINFLIYDLGINFVTSDSGNIFKVEYVVADLLNDSIKAHLVFTEAMAADSSIVNIPFKFINGEITISPSVGVEEPPRMLPAKFELCQNYPNPFNPITRIEYSLPTKSNIKIIVYDILGRELATLINEEKPAGYYDVYWNANNFASGLYFYRMIAERYSKVNKMILIK